VKLLHTKKFHHGDYTMMEDEIFQADEKVQQKKMVEFTRYSEVDSHECEVKGVRRQIVDLEGERLQNLNNTVVRFERSIFYLCDKGITRTIVHNHSDYLEKLKVNNLNWLTLLKISLEIYTGEMKGFANVSDFKDAREAEMLPSMQ